MSRPRSIFLCLLLILVQLLSPWVHAHTGGETGGQLHMPGLERLHGPKSAFTDEADASVMDILVGVQAGIELSGQSLVKFLEAGVVTHSRFPASSEPVPVLLRLHLTHAGETLSKLYLRSGAPPRASPSGSHL